MKFTSLLIPTVLVLILIVAAIKKVDIMGEFTKGAKEGLETAKNLIPPLCLMLTAIGMFRASGALDALVSFLSPLAKAVGLPQEVLPLALLKPFSGSGSFALLSDIFENYGADSFVGRVASTIAGSTETTFYTLAVYYGAVNVKKTRHTLQSALTADVLGFILSALFVRIFMY